ncbi:thiamine phosphate synthase [Enterococcus lemanii]|jgi:thiamine-phosphate pyrophosphorylase|uniref:Thiamine-phosphate synthase n=1 Tax=Enterococcus lemanii TaxID=1159752 RepID=A0ABV9MUU6_9ENTE|nr:thiamine phosphate synthase [Enterococcus lemanii]MBM7708854.1 thiamine-phosphate pyrophosphorylase [Enterococcus lemanii]NLM66511.1 thiamine phosphate synthase [Enterococcus sp.]
MKKNLYQLYLVTGQFDLSDERFLEVIESACQNGVTCVQLREKNRSTRSFFEVAQAVKEITDRYQIPLIINDRVDICLAVDAAGVHIGDEELPVAVTRQLLGANRLLGVTAKTLKRAQQAQEEGADYVGTGAIFPTKTKAGPRTSQATLREIAEKLQIPVVAIGGINHQNMLSLAKLPIAGVAMVSEIMLAQNPAQKVQALCQTLEQFEIKKVE